ncbi:MAG TPA: glycosyltransferase [Anaerolineales bacterium]|nr:glycosyltransferase [Anaerolineales bacterium]
MAVPRVSIIIAVKHNNPNLAECIQHCLELDYPDYEIVVCPDEMYSSAHPKVRIIPTGAVGPAQKRDIAAQQATGEILAFLDDDTYPVREWLRGAVDNFDDPAVAAVGGPAVTPPGDSTSAKASGFVYSSLAGGGNYAYRYLPFQKRLVDDYPTCNLLVRRNVFEKVGGFDTEFWPGEDTKLCLDLTQGLGMKIVYDPAALVYHHRRRLFGPHLRQVQSYGMHRGYFAKRFPATSLRPSYFLPTLIALWMTVGWLVAAAWPGMSYPYLLSWAAYALIVAGSAYLASRSVRLTPYVALGIMTTHLVYGIWFVVGLATPRLREEANK